MKLSKRLETITSYINNDDRVLDVGCDHGYLDIYLALNKKNSLIIASDISKEVIKKTKENIKRYNVADKIKVYCTNGTENIFDDYNTIVVAGMGSYTILNILKSSKKVNKLIICSNNNWDDIRKNISLIGYQLIEERLIYESKKLYSIMLFKKGKNKLSKKEIMIGKYNFKNQKLYDIYLKETMRTYKKIPISNIKRKYNFFKRILFLRQYLRKENR